MEDQSKVRQIDSLSGKEFEHLVAQLLTCLGLEIESQSQGPDGGIDILAKSATDLVSGRYVVQCKRYSQNVGVGAVRDLLGVMSNDRSVNKGILITNAEFTKPALELAHGNPIELIGGSQLGRLLEKHLQERFEAGRRDTLLPPSVDRYLKFIVSSFGSLKSMIDEQQVELDKGLTVRRPKTLRSDAQLGDFFRRNGDGFLAALTALMNQVAHFWGKTSSDQDQVPLQRGFSLVRETIAQMLKQQREFYSVDTPSLEGAGGTRAFSLAYRKVFHALSASFGSIVDSAQGVLDNPDRFVAGKATCLFSESIDLTSVVTELGAELDRLRRSRSFPIWLALVVVLGLMLLGFIILAINPNA